LLNIVLVSIGIWQDYMLELHFPLPIAQFIFVSIVFELQVSTQATII